MDAKTFYDRFIHFLKDSPYKEKCEEEYQNNKGFTEAILLLLEEVLRVDADVGISREYLRIDITSWRNRVHEIVDDAPKGFHPRLWDLEVAVEHENYDGYWMEEVIKLAHINCPLRVVVTYLPIGVDRTEYTDCASAGIRKLSCKQAPENEFLLIIGNSATKNAEDYFHYEPFLFDGTAFRLKAGW